MDRSIGEEGHFSKLLKTFPKMRTVSNGAQIASYSTLIAVVLVISKSGALAILFGLSYCIDEERISLGRNMEAYKLFLFKKKNLLLSCSNYLFLRLYFKLGSSLHLWLGLLLFIIMYIYARGEEELEIYLFFNLTIYWLLIINASRVESLRFSSMDREYSI